MGRYGGRPARGAPLDRRGAPGRQNGRAARAPLPPARAGWPGARRAPAPAPGPFPPGRAPARPGSPSAPAGGRGGQGERGAGIGRAGRGRRGGPRGRSRPRRTAPTAFRGGPGGPETRGGRRTLTGRCAARRAFSHYGGRGGLAPAGPEDPRGARERPGRDRRCGRPGGAGPLPPPLRGEAVGERGRKGAGMVGVRGRGRLRRAAAWRALRASVSGSSSTAPVSRLQSEGACRAAADPGPSSAETCLHGGLTVRPRTFPSFPCVAARCRFPQPSPAAPGHPFCGPPPAAGSRPVARPT